MKFFFLLQKVFMVNEEKWTFYDFLKQNFDGCFLLTKNSFLNPLLKEKFCGNCFLCISNNFDINIRNFFNYIEFFNKRFQDKCFLIGCFLELNNRFVFITYNQLYKYLKFKKNNYQVLRFDFFFKFYFEVLYSLMYFCENLFLFNDFLSSSLFFLKFSRLY